MSNLNSNKLLKWAVIGLVMVAFITACSEDDEDSPNTNTSPFCFSLNNSNSTYVPLTGGTEITVENAEYMYEIDLGFPFAFCGESYQTLYVHAMSYTPTFTYTTAGGITNATEYELSPVGSINLEKKWGSLPGGGSGYLSKFKYETTGGAGNRVTTVEWLDFQYEETGGSGSATVNFQMKFYENGNKLAYHYGTNDITTDFPANNFETLAIGLYADDVTQGLFLSGDASNPTSNLAVGDNELSTFPVAGTLYTFQ